MILVFGGTTEGRLVAEALEKAQLNYIYSTKTSIDFIPVKYGSYRYGAFSEEGLIQFCKDNQIKIIIHASHPFAVELHKTINNAADKLSISVVRYEREFPEKVKDDKVHYLKSYEAVIEYLGKTGINNLLALTGVQSIPLLKPYWINHTTIFRILPRDSSLLIAEKAGFPKENLLLEMLENNQKHEEEIIKKWGIECVLTKESGESGFLSTKIRAALQCKIPILIIEKPLIPARFIKVYNQGELLSEVCFLIK